VFETKAVYAEQVERLFDLCRPLGRGDVLPHETIAAVLGVAPHEGQWQRCVYKLMRRLERERGVTLRVEHTVGYRLLEPDEQLGEMHRLLRMARRRVRRGIEKVTCLPDDGLTMHQRLHKHFASEQGKQVEKTIGREIAFQARLAQPSEPEPRVAPPQLSPETRGFLAGRRGPKAPPPGGCPA
jgi:hypothetical protein